MKEILIFIATATLFIIPPKHNVEKSQSEIINFCDFSICHDVDISEIVAPSVIHNSKNPLRVWDMENVSDVILLAMMLNDECAYCTIEEKGWIGRTLQNRVDGNYKSYGSTYYNQLFQRLQFSGSQVPNSTKVAKWVNPTNPNKARYGNPLLGKRYQYDSTQKLHQVHYNIAYDIIVNCNGMGVPDNLVMFCNPSISTDTDFVKEMLKSVILEGEMVYSIDNTI